MPLATIADSFVAWRRLIPPEGVVDAIDEATMLRDGDHPVMEQIPKRGHIALAETMTPDRDLSVVVASERLHGLRHRVLGVCER